MYTLKVYFKANGNNEQTLRHLDEFEANYRPENAVGWYIHPSFLSSIINQAFRQRNTEILFLFGIFVQDTYTVLNNRFKEYRAMAEDCGRMILKVYRCQIMSTEEIDRLKPTYKKYLVNTSLLSTSSKESVAKMYFDPKNNSNQVLFEINYDPCLLSRPYAPISDLSYIRHEAEVLFMPGTLFEKLDVSYKTYWTIKLKLKYNSPVEFQYEKESRNFKNRVIRFGKRLLFEASQKDRDNIFSKLIDLYPNERLWLAAIKFGTLGKHQELILKDYTSAMYNYEKAIRLWREFDETDIDGIKAIAALYNQLGDCCQKFTEKSYNQSINYSKDLITIPTLANCDRVDLLNNLAVIYETKSKIDGSDMFNENMLLAIKYQEQVVNDASNDSTFNDYDMTYCMERLGRFYELVHDYDKAIRTYDHVIRLYLDQSEEDLFIFISLHQRIATIYLKYLKNYSQAIKYQLETHRYNSKKYNLEPTTMTWAEIQFNTRGMVNSYMQLADIYFEMKDYLLTRKNLNAALDLYGTTEQKLQDDRDIIKIINEKLKNIP